MREAIDLYAKVLIGTFSFIGPSFTLLIPIFFPAIERSQLKDNTTIENLLIRTKENLKYNNSLSELNKLNADLKMIIRENKKENQLLKPGRQVKRLFFSLFLSILLVIVYYLLGSPIFTSKLYLARIVTIITSVFSFFYCLTVLWQIFNTIIRIKTEENLVLYEEI